MTDEIYDSQAAARFLAREIGDGRHYAHLLNDMRRGKAAGRLDAAFKEGGRLYYLGSDLRAFVEAESYRKDHKPEFFSIEGDSPLDILIKARAMLRSRRKAAREPKARRSEHRIPALLRPPTTLAAAVE